MDEKKEYARQRWTIHHQYRNLLASLTRLFEGKIIAKLQYERLRRRVDEQYEQLKRERLLARRPGGRPRTRVLKKCRKLTCEQMTYDGYCCREHAPLGYFGVSHYAGTAE
jgi:hypothetical protein